MIDTAIKHFESRGEFCRAVGMTPQFLSQIEAKKRPLPPKFALKIEQVTNGAIKREQLRPDIYPPSDN
ncbi:MAG TPA: YdaS family helix-turn-helix protein [Cellvibrionaceae bacterium]|nr:YdaS family helix-turn-helix protein [Cellvibrionaceae bacterium]HNG59613.1 YdaS family helix-turn-helix protein [Cellvibrionaceae bacterium]